eukprot:gene18165-23823_t
MFSSGLGSYHSDVLSAEPKDKKDIEQDIRSLLVTFDKEFKDK